MYWWLVLVLAIFLFLLCAILLIGNVFVPNLGILVVLAIVALVGAIALFFQHSTTASWTGIIVAIIMIMTIGKAVTLDRHKRQKSDAVSDSEQLKALLGKKATVISPLRPVGMCDFSGLRLECVAESGYVDKGKTVEVIKVEGTQLTVRQVENS